MLESATNSSTSGELPFEQKEDLLRRKPRRKFNISKADIGLPSQFQHVSHIGWDPNIGFNVICGDPTLSNFFKNEEAQPDNKQDLHSSHSTNNAVSNQKEEGYNKKRERKSLSTPSSPTFQRQKLCTNMEVGKFLQKAGSSKNHPQTTEQDPIAKAIHKQGGKITKADISKPSEFRHISHVGWSESGFNVECNDPHVISALRNTETEAPKTSIEKTRSLSAPPSLLGTNPLPLKELENTQMDSFHKRNERISKADIGFPFDFRHLSHITWDPETGFNIDCDDPELSAFLNLAGVTVKDLQDQQTRDFICEFINRHDGQVRSGIGASIERPASFSTSELAIASPNQEVIN